MPTRSVFVPPGGFAGFAQQTVAVQALLGNATRRKTTRKKAKRKKGSATRRASTTRAASPRRKKKRKGPLVKGSPEARRRMKQLRAMRK